MKAFRQIFVLMIVVAAGLYIWIAYVPAARPLLAQTGLLDLLGIEQAAQQQAASGGRPGRGGPTQVIAERVSEAVQADRISAIGDGRAQHAVTVRSNAVGVITDLQVTAGTFVEAGSTIALLESEAEEIALEQAQLRLEEARADAARNQQLETSGAVTELRLRETQVALRTAELAARQAALDLSQRRIETPIAGWVGIIDVEQGDRLAAQDVIATITDRSEILIDFRVPERVVGKIALGQQIAVTPLGLRDTVLTGEIAAIDSVVDRASRTLLVQGRVANDDDRLRAGMAFSVGMSFPGETLMSIPPLAVQWSSTGPFVWAVREGKAAQVPVVIVQRNADAVLVTSDDLKSGEDVVTEGVQTLRPGSEVAPVSDATAASAVFQKDGT